MPGLIKQDGGRVFGLECHAISDGGRFPIEHTGRGADVSPELLLENLPPETVTLAVIRAAGVPAAAPSGAAQGIAYGVHRYAGPKPPRGSTHRYRFTAYALDTALPLGAGAGKWRLRRAMKGHILQQASLTASFGL